MKVKNPTEKSRIQVGIDKNLKENAEMILEELGLNPTTAITILYKQVVARGEFPVEIKLSEESLTVPGVTIRITLRSTGPLLVAGSPICSQMATDSPS